MLQTMDSDFHSESSSSMEESGDSGDENDLGETCYFGKRILHLPECFCFEEEVFKEVLNPSTWKMVLNSHNGDRLKRLLPDFPENDEKEKEETLRKLVEGENFKFGNPLNQFFSRLKDGFLSTDVVEVTNALKRANYREYKNQQQQYAYHLLRDILISRKKLVDATHSLPPDQTVKMQQFIAKPKDATLSERTRLRYFSTLQDLCEEIGENDTSSEDENYPECSLPKVSKKYKKQVHINETLSSPEFARVTSTISSLPGHPSSGHFFNHLIDMFEVSEERYREMLSTHRLRTVLDPDHPELVISHIDLKEITSRSNLNKRPNNRGSENLLKKKRTCSENSEKHANSVFLHDSVEGESSTSFSNIFPREESSFNSSGPEVMLDNTSPSVQETEVQTDPLIILDDCEDSQIHDNIQQANRLSSPNSEVHQYPTCFFALLRDIFCESVEQKLSAVKLEEKVKNWQGGPTAALFEWLNFQESWSDLVTSALKFLAGDLISILPDTFVPFLDYKEKQQQWQWIGSGRDSDEQMFDLCQQWLESKDDVSSDILETSQGSPPPPRVTTGWIVRPTADEEKKIYREQECIRYQNPHKAFTFKVHGYEAVVGPVKGVYGKESGINKAREHSLLTSDRPPFVTILSLVRDSAARLPNGEGTRADICELLKDSQYLAQASDQQIHTVVSGALDRLHYEKDPCVKYDVNRKLWIYLHRHRTEEEFERIHQAQAAAAKARKAVQKNKIPKFKSKEISRAVTTTPECVTVLNVDIPSTATQTTTQSPRGGASPRTQGSPKSSHAISRYVMHAVSAASQAEVKCATLNIENQSKMSQEVLPKEHQSKKAIKTESHPQISIPVSTTCDNEKLTLISNSQVQDVGNSHQTSLGGNLPLSNAKNMLGKPTQIVSVTPVSLKSCSSDQGRTVISVPSHTHETLNVDMKPSSPSFVGQPPVLQPILNQLADKSSSVSSMSTNVTPSVMSSSSSAVTKAKVTCTSIAGLPSTAIAGFQTIVIKQEPGLRTCSGVPTIPVLSIEERLPCNNQSSLNSGPVVARLVHGSQYLSFSNLVAGSTSCSPSKPLTGTVQNFRVQGGNICQQVLSTSTIKVMHSSPVSTITDARVPVIALKNQLASGKESNLLNQASALNVCGRLYQMTNVRNAVVSKESAENKTTDVSAPKENPDILSKDVKEVTIPTLCVSTSAYNTPVTIPNRNQQTIIKVSPKIEKL
ncbi:nuclear factor related to kappa-B-binding protein-like [Uloborus diversus]|uniref:nuclear factor related to kappa-B-binding protein-like n=1 Tax=Uloborus diversus TaxID=327109 RepID=UPI002409877D|nr:nuclear factor related to kappa-B-binding protein-like [Uloborus diversus]